MREEKACAEEFPGIEVSEPVQTLSYVLHLSFITCLIYLFITPSYLLKTMYWKENLKMVVSWVRDHLDYIIKQVDINDVKHMRFSAKQNLISTIVAHDETLDKN